jgi:hypothetical protein
VRPRAAACQPARVRSGPQRSAKPRDSNVFRTRWPIRTHARRRPTPRGRDHTRPER